MKNNPSQEYIKQICDLYGDVYDDREEDSAPGGLDWQPGVKASHLSLSAFQHTLEQEYNIKLSTSKIRKILISGGCWTTERSREVQELYEKYGNIREVAETLEVSDALVTMYLPYEKTVYDLEDKSGGAKRTEKWRERRNDDGDWKEWLWRAIIEMEGEFFTTAGRGSRPGVEFKYEISREPGQGGRHYNGESVPGYGNEMWVTTTGGVKKKSISRSTVELAYRKAQEADGDVAGPRALGIPGAHSYLYPILVKLGVIRK